MPRDRTGDELAALLDTGMPIGEIARRLDRPYIDTLRQASRLTTRAARPRERKVPRGVGLDKRSTRAHMKALWSFAGTFTQYARKHGVNADTLALALTKHCPDAWRDYVTSRAEPPVRPCAYCERQFIPNNARQEHCSPACASRARSDRAYFNGNRRRAVGMTHGVCQLCGREGDRGLSAHHVLGKENDPDDAVLVALCQACHNIVTLLAARNFVADEVAWEALIALAWTRKHVDDTLRVTVAIDADIDTTPRQAVREVRKREPVQGVLGAPDVSVNR